MGFVHPGIVESLDFTVFQPLTSCRGGYSVSLLRHKEKPVGHLFGVHSWHNMVNTVDHIQNSEENLTNIGRFLKDSGCESVLIWKSNFKRPHKS